MNMQNLSFLKKKGFTKTQCQKYTYIFNRFAENFALVTLLSEICKTGLIIKKIPITFSIMYIN